MRTNDDDAPRLPVPVRRLPRSVRRDRRGDGRRGGERQLGARPRDGVPPRRRRPAADGDREGCAVPIGRRGRSDDRGRRATRGGGADCAARAGGQRRDRADRGGVGRASHRDSSVAAGRRGVGGRDRGKDRPEAASGRGVVGALAKPVRQRRDKDQPLPGIVVLLVVVVVRLGRALRPAAPPPGHAAPLLRRPRPGARARRPRRRCDVPRAPAPSSTRTGRDGS
mmetsp:Transcript_37371/g.79711  ORF Transcript_37371/g.79711 Transcript_37371/m.79711 type:complete len:224 (+) Transcript_37371:3-674(+)